ncbi:MAG: hypothetical protein JWL62_3125 [Hyphomicrobiales bacterium]|nr:hypothetical protein [Hyphomicrobiales bacterium]
MHDGLVSFRRLMGEVILACSMVMILVGAGIVFFQLAPGPDQRFNREHVVMGHDFSHFWIAGSAVLDGHPTDAFDIDTHEANQRRYFGTDVPTFGWHYPPPFLLPATALALLPLPHAFAVWMISTNALLLFALWRIVPGWRLQVVALGSPILFQNINYGQNAALSAALVALALTPFIRGRSVSSWALGLLSYKPNLGLPIPFVLAGSGAWKTIGGIACVIGAQVLVSGWLLGFDTWRAFIRSLSTSEEILLEAMGAGVARYDSAFGAARVLGLTVSAAFAVQIASAILAVLLCTWAWRGKGDRRLKAALLIATLLLCTPYLLEYELLLLLPAAVMLFAYARERGFGDWDVPMLALLWALPMISQSAAALLHLPLGFVAIVCFLVSSSTGCGARD